MKTRVEQVIAELKETGAGWRMSRTGADRLVGNIYVACAQKVEAALAACGTPQQEQGIPDAQIEFVLKVLSNMGIDTECGACMEMAFCGIATIEHEHSDSRTPPEAPARCNCALMGEQDCPEHGSKHVGGAKAEGSA